LKKINITPSKAMKYLFILLLTTIVCNPIFSQDDIFTKKGKLEKIKWDSLESKIPYPDRVKLVNSLKSTNAEIFHNFGKEKVFYNLFHIVDLNSDGKPDLIFSKPEVYTRVWLNTGNNLKLILKDNGIIVKINIDNGNTGLTIIDVPYDPSEMYLLKIFKMVTLKTGPKFVYESCTSVVNKTNMPHLFNLNQAFEVKIENSELRIDAKIDSTTDYFYLDFNGNGIATYKKGSKGHILFEQKGSDGKDWYFVRMDNNIIPVETFHDWNDKKIHPTLPKHIHTLGWIDGSSVTKQ
jgi:hypothetical protein